MNDVLRKLDEMISQLNNGYITHQQFHNDTQELIKQLNPTNKELMTKDLGQATFERTDYLLTTINKNYLDMMKEVMNNQAKLIKLQECVDRIQGLSEGMLPKIDEIYNKLK